MRKLAKFTLIIISSIILINCNQSKSDTSVKDIEEKVEEPKVFKIVTKLKSSKEDKFSVLMNNIKVDEFQSMNISAFEKIPISSSPETFQAEFFENQISNRIVLDLGSKEVKTVKIYSTEISYGKNSILVSGEDLLDYFNLNKFVSFDDKNQLVTKKDNGQHFPRLILKPSVINRLKK